MVSSKIWTKNFKDFCPLVWHSTGQKSLQYLVHILGEMMTINSFWQCLTFSLSLSDFWVTIVGFDSFLVGKRPYKIIAKLNNYKNWHLRFFFQNYDNDNTKGTPDIHLSITPCRGSWGAWVSSWSHIFFLSRLGLPNYCSWIIV